jgi:hypothetical protein
MKLGHLTRTGACSPLDRKKNLMAWRDRMLSDSRPSYHGEPLPNGCPPDDAIAAPDDVLLRLTSSPQPSAEDFAVGSANGRRKKPDSCNPCTWLSCSVWRPMTPRETLLALTRLPKMSDKKFIAHVKVNSRCGIVKPHQKDDNHLSFWMFLAFSPEKAIVKIEPL